MKPHKMYIKMILSSLLRRRSRMLVALLSVIIGATIMSGMLTIYYDIPRQLGKEFRSYGANFVILPDAARGIDEASWQKINRILADSGLGMLGKGAPYRYVTAKINQKPFYLAGTDFEEVRINSPFWYIEGEWVRADEPEEVMIGLEVAKTLGLSLGDSFRVEGVKYGREIVASKIDDSSEASKLKDKTDAFYSARFRVKGIITTGGAEEGFIFLNLATLDSLLEDEVRLDGIECSIEGKGPQLEALAKRLHEQLPTVVGRPVRRVTQSQDIVLGKLQVLVLLVNLVVLLLTMISVLTTMIAVVTERRKEIGLKKALGAPDQSIIWEFMGEGISLGLLGGFLGSILGFFFAQRVSLSVFGRAIEFSFWIVPVTLLLAVGMTVVASIWPVKQATKIDPALVLRGE